jgi:hypothetical protein
MADPRPHPQQAMGVEQIPPHQHHMAFDSTTTLHHTDAGDDKSTPSLHLHATIDHILLNLAPSFFSINMATGITSILLYNLPYNAPWLRSIGIAVFVLNIVLFALLCLGNIARYIRFKGLFSATINHLLSGMFWGTLPMGLVTIIVSE